MQIKYVVEVSDAASVAAVTSFIGQLRGYVARRRHDTDLQLSRVKGITNTNLLNRELYVWDEVADTLSKIEVKNGAL